MNARTCDQPRICRLLLPGDAPDYCGLRALALDDAPWAFARSACDDPGRDPSHIARLLGEPVSEGGYAIAGAWVQTNAQCTLVAVAGVMRIRTLKMAHRASIWGVFSHPRHRGEGHARAVMELAIATAWSWPAVASPFGPHWPAVTSIGLSASARSAAALRLYHSLGFEVWGTEPDCIRVEPGSPGAAELHMIKQR